MVGTVEITTAYIPGVVGRGGSGGWTQTGVFVSCAALMTIGGLAPAAVKAGNRLAAVGTVPLPVAYCGWFGRAG